MHQYFSQKQWIKPLFALLLATLTFTMLAGQAVVTPFGHREIGLRNINWTQANGNGSSDDGYARQLAVVSYGAELFYLKTTPKLTFWRGSLGLGHQVSSIDVQDHRFTSTLIVSGYHEKLTAFGSFAIGRQLPQFTKPGLRRLRLRAGLELHLESLLADNSWSTSQLIDANLITIQRRSSVDDAQLDLFAQAAILFQGEFRLFKQCFVGIEWSFGPSMWIQQSESHFSTAGLQPSTKTTKSREFGVTLPTHLFPPSLSIGYSF